MYRRVLYYGTRLYYIGGGVGRYDKNNDKKYIMNIWILESLLSDVIIHQSS